ncbi:MAG: hypothetical protein IPO81_01280 [Kouleothrix sp.]|nr:hypothetical protein [Kouleothrix sp.]
MTFSHDQELCSALLGIIRIAADAHSVEGLAEQSIDLLLERGAVLAAGLWLRDANGLNTLAQRGFERPLPVAPIHRVAASGIAAYVDTDEATAGDRRAHGARTLAALPLNVGQECIGVLALVKESGEEPGVRALYEAIAGHLALALRDLHARRPGAPPASSERDWDTFLSHAVHEIKNPLASVKGYADLLLRRAAKEQADAYQKGLTIISQQIARTTLLLEQISDLARADADQLQIDRHEADLASVVRRSVDEARGTTDQHQLSLEGDSAPLLARLDELRIGQVIDTMLSNAIKFSPHGGPIAVRLRRSDDSATPAATVVVADHGIGVPPGQQERVFERFFRGSNVGGLYRGLGVGLFTARAIVEHHGGRMWLESEPEQGATCYMMLPLR